MRTAPPYSLALRPAALLLLVALPFICLPTSSSAAEVRLLTAPYVRAGAYHPVRVIGTGPGRHELSGEGVLSVGWEGAGEVTLPVLLASSPGGRLRLEVDGETVSLPVVALGAEERLVVDLTGRIEDPALIDIGSRLFGGKAVRTLSAAPSGAAAAWGIADAVILDVAPSREERRAWMSAGVAVVVVAAPEGEGWRALGPDGLWVAQPVDVPAPGVIEPGVYAAVSSWQPGRTPQERRAIILGCALYGVVIVVICWAVRRPARRAGLVVVVSMATMGVTAAWAWLRPDVAVRQADVLIAGADRQPLSERWLFVRSPAAGEGAVARIGFVGETRPAGYDRQHWEALEPLVFCDEAGNPLELRLRLPAGYTAAVVQRTSGGARDGSRFDSWASPVITQHYRRRLGAFDASESPDGAVLSLEP